MLKAVVLPSGRCITMKGEVNAALIRTTAAARRRPDKRDDRAPVEPRWRPGGDPVETRWSRGGDPVVPRQSPPRRGNLEER
ncbi:hypothetical protein F2P81_002816 [Scophthalmus maximus]|uniref:Uncharacterized protein n=1 Tax=Scophthalmus maximus TaxID=52904 RepID=A0A6A4THW2_SCOMX|nr:hypothetical protein F2P81_002816 [Scophthalmus maximus]